MASSKSKAEAGDWSVKLMAELKSLSLMMLFFAIWLDERSRSPALRAALLTRPER